MPSIFFVVNNCDTDDGIECKKIKNNKNKLIKTSVILKNILLD